MPQPIPYLAFNGNCADAMRVGQDTSRTQAAQRAGLILHEWVRSATQFGAASFLEEPKYFVPIPVCLVSVVC